MIKQTATYFNKKMTESEAVDLDPVGKIQILRFEKLQV